MLLAIDVGNTNAKIALFAGGALADSAIVLAKDFAEDPLLSIRDFAKGRSIDRAIASTVIKGLRPSLEKALSEVAVSYRVIGQGEEGVIETTVDDLGEVGSDLMADVRGAIRLYGYPAFVADMGTADKCILVDEKGRFSALSIGLGLSESHKALVRRADALWEEELAIPPSPLGKNTKDCINAGLLYSRKYAIEGFYGDYAKDMPQKPRKILTGGNAKALHPLLPDFEYVPFLSLIGLADIAGDKK